MVNEPGGPIFGCQYNLVVAYTSIAINLDLMDLRDGSHDNISLPF